MGLTGYSWLKIGVLTLFTCLLFRNNLYRLWDKTNPFYGEANWQHAICVPLVGLYYLYIHRDELLKAKVKPAIEALPLLILGPLLLLYGIYPGQNDYIKDLAIPVTLAGLVLFTCGWRVMKYAWFPILFLICAFPWPGLVYSRVASPLQDLAAKVAVEVMKLTGVTAEQSGTKINIGKDDPLGRMTDEIERNNRLGQVDKTVQDAVAGLSEGRGSDAEFEKIKAAAVESRKQINNDYLQAVEAHSVRTLNVAEACAGMRSLMTFITVGAAMAFLSPRPMWQKLIMTASAVPIAIACNVMRVSGQGLLDRYASHEWSAGFAHQFAGMVMLIPAFFLLMLVGKILDRAVIEVADPGTEKKSGDVLSRSQSATKSQPDVLKRRRPAAKPSTPELGK